MIGMFATYVDPSARESVGAVLDSTFLSEGVKVRAFEDALTQKFDIPRPIALNSGSTALELALELAGIAPGDEVITSPQTFIATGIAILRQGAVPVFADIEYDTGNIDPDSVQKKITPKTKVILPIHWGGYPCDMDRLSAIAKEHGLKVVEDAAHALGASYHGKSIGAISDFTCFSFQAIKHVTTGDGGAVCCLSAADEQEGMKKRWFGIDRAHSPMSILGEREYDLKDPGFKFHMNDYAAALGLANLKNLDERMKRRRMISSKYREAFKNVDGITLWRQEEHCMSANWLFGFHVERREDFIRAMASRGITASVVHLRIDANSCFGGIRKDLPVQDQFNNTQIHIPLHDMLSDDEVGQIIDSVTAGW